MSSFIRCLLLPLLFVPGVVSAQAPDDDEDSTSAAGLVGVYRSGGVTVRRLDADISFRWPNRPDPRLPDGPFSVEWTGRLLVQRSGQYRFFAHANGEVTITVAGQTVLSGNAQDRWLDGTESRIAFGDHPMTVRYRGPERGAALRLFWSSDAFSLEPIQSQVLSCDPPSQLLQRHPTAHWYDAYRCARCHGATDGLPPDPAPSLAAVAGSLPAEWIVQKLTRRPETGDRMPHFGFSADDAADVAAFLRTASSAPKLRKAAATQDRDSDVRRGTELVQTLGCLACHQFKGPGATGPYAGGDLSQVRTRRSRDWVETWLQQPKRLNADHRMPVVKLSKDERRQLAWLLGGEPTPAAPQPTPGQIARGRQLAARARCANCHTIPGLQPDLHTATGSGTACLADADQREPLTPAYPQLGADLKHRLNAWHHALRPGSAAGIRGARLLARRNCTACHPRDADPGIVTQVGQLVEASADFRTDSQSLIPPSLTAVGDKLHNAALSRAIAGELPVRLPWLRVRMPRFEHSDAHRDALVEHLIDHDRIPARPTDPPAATEPVTSQRLVIGQNLVGAAGFNCTACHSAGTYTPRNLAPGTRGSDLLMPAKRMRREFFLRWTRSPIRIVPGMEMPSITRPVPNILAGDLDKQLATVWDALNDDKFTVPTHPGSFEQSVVVDPGQPARIIRDVFTDPAGNGFIARPLAIGLNNGHNLLFDLDTFGLRHWWFGDMARQRTEGKSWYWDVAGIRLAAGSPGSDVVLRNQAGATLRPATREATNGQLQSWQQLDYGVEFRYRLRFDIAGTETWIPVTESVVPLKQDGRQGWSRTVILGDVPVGHTALLRMLPGSSEYSVSSPQPAVNVAETGHCREFEKGRVTVHSLAPLERPATRVALPELPPAPVEHITSTPGFDGVRLPLSRSIMPTAIQWSANGTLVFTSLKGHVWAAVDTNQDGLPDRLTAVEEGLAAPFGILPDGRDLLVAHKPEIVRLTDTNGDGRADRRTVVATGWGYSDNYHDWTCGLVRDSRGNIYFGLGSDYSQPQRPRERSRWRGAVLRLRPEGQVEPVSWSFRYPIGFAVDSQDRVFVTDNQGVQNTFNEINHVQPGRHYGVPSRHEPNPETPETPPAIRVPHPWVRSVNGLVFLPADHASPFAGQAIGCEYDTHMLIRLSFQTVGDTVQGAAYYFSRPGLDGGGENFVGPICAAVAKNGDIYVGSIYDSGWLGGRNTGAIERLRFRGDLPNGIRELRATADGFDVRLCQPVHPADVSPADFSIAAYTRKWQGSYATADSSRHPVTVAAVRASDDGRRFRLIAGEELRPGFVYEVTVGGRLQGLFPATGHYTMNRVPQPD